MDHHHGGHGGAGDVAPMCNMNMLFTWDTTNLCIVFRSWHIRSTLSLVSSLFAVVLLAMGYEALRSLCRRYEVSLEKQIEAMPRQVHDQASSRAHILKAVLYGLQNFYAFMLMLIFMTYNGWVMIAVSLGATLGYLLFGRSTSATKDNACH